MIKKIIVKIIAISFISNICLASGLDEVKWVAQDYIPYSYMDKSSKNTGMAIDIVDEILRKTGSTKNIKNIQLNQFSKMFIFRNNDKNTVFFPLIENSKTKKNFKLVGPLDSDRQVIFAKAEKGIIINDLPNDLKPYLIAVKEDSYSAKQLDDLDVSNRSIKFSDSDEENMRRLENDKVQLFACNERVGKALMNELGMDSKNYQVVYRFKEGKLFFAFNKDTSDEIIMQFQKALDDMKTSKSGKISEYDAISKKYSY